MIAMAFLVVSGLVHGWYTMRWSQAEELPEAAARVALVPQQVGAWAAQPAADGAEAIAQAGAKAWWMRSYVHPRLRGPVLVTLLCGGASAMAVHNPEICFRRSTYEMQEDPTAYTVRNELGEPLGRMRTARFATLVGPGKDLRILWAWNDGSAWQAPPSPRRDYGGRPFLYKLYIAHEFPDDPALLGDDVGVELARLLLPELDKTLLSRPPSD